MKPGDLIEFIKRKRFTTISDASVALGVDVDYIRKIIDKLRIMRHLRRLDMSRGSGCDSGDCTGCKGCSTAFAIQEDGKPIVYILSPFI